MKNLFKVITVLMVSVTVVACGGGGSNPDVEQHDVQVEDAQDAVETDLAADVAADTAADVGTDSSIPGDATDTAGADAAEDVVADVPADLPTTIEIDGGYAPIVDDPYKDILPKDVVWESLPKMPSGKVFSTRYAAGAGVASITPDWLAYLAGYGNCAGNDQNCHKTDLVHDPLQARAVAIADTESGVISIFVGIDTIGLIDVDIVGAHRTIQKVLYQEFGIHFPGSNAILAPSHSHMSLDTIGFWGPMLGAGRDMAYLQMVFDGVAEACRLAVQNLQDVDIAWATANYERAYDEDEESDTAIWTVKGTSPLDSSVIFTLTRWSAHPTLYEYEDRVMSADYVGTFRKKIEDEVGGTAVYLNGPIGSVYPDRFDDCGAETEAFPEGDRTPGREEDNVWMEVTCAGYGLADATIAALATAKPLAETGVQLRHSMFYFHPYNDFLMFALQNIPLPMPDCYSEDYDCHIWARMSLIRLGDLSFVTAPGEAFPSFANDMAELVAEAEMPNPIVVGLAQGWMGYLMTEEQFNDPANGLDYNKGLCPGPDLHPSILAALRQMLGLPENT